MCTDFTDIIVENDLPPAQHNDSDISPSHWYRFVDHVTKEPLKVCCALFFLFLFYLF